MCIINIFVYNNVRFEKKYMTSMEATGYQPFWNGHTPTETTLK